MSNYIFTDKAYFNFTSCIITLNNNTLDPCPQASLTKTSGNCADCSTCSCNIYTLTRNTTYV
jgi:hypothetical protein